MTISNITNSAAATQAAKPAVDPQVKKAAQGFEAFFLRQIIEDMRSGSLGDDIFGSGATQKFQEMSDATLAENIAETGRFGFAAMLEKQFSGAVAPPPDTAGG